MRNGVCVREGGSGGCGGCVAIFSFMITHTYPALLNCVCVFSEFDNLFVRLRNRFYSIK